MIMKNIFRIIAVNMAVVLMFSSCEDILDQDPKDRLTFDVFFHSRTECELWANNYYTMFPSAEGVYSEPFDVIVRNQLADEISGVRIPTDKDGNWSWDKLRDINDFLIRSYQCEDDAVRLEFEGISRFFRAYFYFEKVKRFGDVPWYDKPLDAASDDLYKPRDSRQLVMSKILDDINFAIDNIPSDKDVYKVTRWTALALKTRICLFEGTYRKYRNMDGWEDLLNECVKASSEFVNGTTYTIYTTGSTPYQDLFTSQKAIDKEIILARAFGSGAGITHDVNGHLTGSTMGRPGMTRNVVNTYLMTDGTRYTDQAGWQTKTFKQECTNRDKRMAQTLRTPGYKRIGGTKELAPNLSVSMTGYQPIKYLTEEKYDANKLSTNDMPLFRLAEVLLSYAEAKAELGTLTQTDLDKAIQPLRMRAGLPNINMASANASPDPYLADAATGYPNVTGPNKGVILEIRRERTLETLMEGLRYWDIMRWKEGARFDKPIEGLYFPGEGSYDLDENGSIDVVLYTGTKPSGPTDAIYLKLNTDIKLSNGTSGYVLVHSDIIHSWNEDRDYLYPIPIEERILTQGALTQNPGWNDGLPY